MDNTEQRNTLVLYPSAICNLNCSYCYIDKNPALQRIDAILKESFSGDYYVKFAKEMFPNPQQLTGVEFWGGEPSLGLNRTIPTIKEYVRYYTTLDSFFMSTNLTSPTGITNICEFFNMIGWLGKEYNRKMQFTLQMSLDGPVEINDSQRGSGVTKKFFTMFNKICGEVNEICNKYPALQITLQFKPTLTSKIIRDHLLKPSNVIKYYQFFEVYNDIFLSTCKADNASLVLVKPNTASPSPHTVQDGKDFAQFCKICDDVMRESNNGANYFKYFVDLVPFRPRYPVDYSKISYCQSCGACGSGLSMVGLLPYDYISCCHSGFVNLISDYKLHCADKQETALDFRLFMDKSNYLIRHKDKYSQYEKNVSFVYNDNSKVKLGNIAAMISLLAKNGQIDKKYIDTREALKGALFMQASTAYCFRDTTGTTGSAALYPVGIIRLLLNGAREVIES